MAAFWPPFLFQPIGGHSSFAANFSRQVGRHPRGNCGIGIPILPVVEPAPGCHSREGWNLCPFNLLWIPARAEMTDWGASSSTKTSLSGVFQLLRSH
jgi:hypothetical protein